MDFNPYDVATKELVWEDPSAGWSGFGSTRPCRWTWSNPASRRSPPRRTRSSGSGGQSPFLLNLEFQGSHATDLVRTLWFRQVALDYQHDLPVLTVLILMRKEANSPEPDRHLRA